MDRHLVPCLRLAALTLGLAALAAPPAVPYAATKPLKTPARFAEGVVSTGHDDAHVTFTRDGRQLYFVRSTPDFAHWTVLTSRFEKGRWSQPEVAPFSGRWSDADVVFSPDGQKLFFISTRPVGDGPEREDTELWVMDRSGTGWGPPRHIDELSSPGSEWFPTFTNSGTLYFGSERPGGKGQSDLWRAKWLGDRFGPPENLGEVLNTSEQEIEPFISPDERFLIFSAKGRPEGKGAYDLFVTFRCDGKWTPPRPLGAGVNSSGWDFGARISPDGRSLFFTSNRSDLGTAPAKPRTTGQFMKELSAPGNGLRDVYRVDVDALDLRSPCGDLVNP